LKALDPINQAKADKLRLSIEEHRGRLLDRGQIVTGLVARQQLLVDSLARGPASLAAAIYGQSVDKTTTILQKFIDQVRAQQCEVPEMLRLTSGQSSRLGALLAEIEGEGEEKITNAK